jgi:hypothetical protein
MLPAGTRETAVTGQALAGRLPARRPGGAVERVLSATYPGAAEAVGQARRQLAKALAGVPAAEDAVFCRARSPPTPSCTAGRGGPAGSSPLRPTCWPGRWSCSGR